MVSYPTWDFENCRPADLDLDCRASSYEGGRALTGVTHALDYSGGGIWAVTYGRVQLFTPESHRAWGAAAARMNGSVLPMNILIPVRYVNPFPTATPADIPVADTVPSYIAGITGDGAAVGATTMKIRILRGTALKAGHLFSINHATKGWRLYRVVEILTSTDSPTTDTDATLYNLTIRPPLREAIVQSQALEFDWPRCIMRLKPDESMAWSISGYWRGEPSASFVEYFAP